jgi:hypothetical protein
MYRSGNLVNLKLLFWICFAGLNALALSPAAYLPPLEIFNWWDKAQHAIGFGEADFQTLAVLNSLHHANTSNPTSSHGCIAVNNVAHSLWRQHRFSPSHHSR